MHVGLEDLLGDLRYARRRGDLGRLALLLYCEVRRWARMAGEQALAEHSSTLMTNCPYATREQFLEQVDSLIIELEEVALANRLTGAGAKAPLGTCMLASTRTADRQGLATAAQ